MKHCCATLALIISLALPLSTAMAQVAEHDQPHKPWDVGEGALILLGGAGMQLGGTLTFLGIGYGIGSSQSGPTDMIGNVEINRTGFFLAAATGITVVPFATAGIINYMGDTRAYRGGYWPAYLGASLGALASYGLIYGLNVATDNGELSVTLAILGMPLMSAGGGLLGYYLTHRYEDGAASTTHPRVGGALVSYSHDENWTWAAPVISVGADDEGEVHVHVMLAGGRF